MLLEKAPKIKWESARFIGNIAAIFPIKLNKTITNLLIKTTQQITVVRWATSFALSKIIKLKTSTNKKLIPIIKDLCQNEIDNALKKKYLQALKKVEK